LLDDLLPTSRRLAVYGANWAGLIDQRHIVAEHFPNEELRKIYSSAGIVLSDHWEDMREHGFISNRVYDAVACGALVISDRVDGVEERFGGAVVTYETPEELRALIERFIDDPEERQVRGAAGRARVVEKHTFAHRVDSLLNAVSERIEVGEHPLRIRS
jgi:spore maturation protein CgeB